MVGRGHGQRWKAATCGLALAAALPAPARAQDAAELRTVLFGSLEAGRSSFANVGAKHALGGPLDRSGPALMAVAGYGGRFERDPAAPGAPLAFRHAAQGSALLGYQHMLGWGALAAFVGPEIDHETFAHDRANGGESGPKFGARLHGEAWLHPSPDTLVTATLIAGSARPSLWSRGSLGYRLWRDVFVGPEASAYAADRYREWRVGVHATGLALGRTSLRVSAGWREDSETRRGGAYLGLAGHVALDSR